MHAQRVRVPYSDQREPDPDGIEDDHALAHSDRNRRVRARVVAGMTEDQRIGQLFLLGLADDQLGTTEQDAIRTQHFGSVWFVEQSKGGVAPIRTVANAVQVLATAETTASVRFFVGANQEGGIIQSISGPGFSTIPSALDQSEIDPGTLGQWRGSGDASF